MIGIEPKACPRCCPACTDPLSEAHVAAHAIVEIMINSWARPCVEWLSKRLTR